MKKYRQQINLFNDYHQKIVIMSPQMMNRWGEKILIIGALSIVLLTQIAAARYSFDGVPYTDKLDLAARGTLKGGVYVGESYKLDFPPCTRTFAMPEDVKIKWARLYVGVWGGTERYEGWVHTTLNGHDLGKTTLRGENDDNPHVYCSGHGVYWVYYEVTEKVAPGLNTAITNTSRGERGNKLDGRVYSIILAAIYEDSNAPEITYWVADGNVNLHGRGWAGATPTLNDFASVSFTGSIAPANVERAHLSVVYLAGNPGDPDYLEFNGRGIGGADVANSGDGTTYGIDLKTFDVTEYIQPANSVRFIRGKDVNGDGKIDVDDEGKQEGEHYLHPVLAVLVAEHRSTEKAMPDFSVELELPLETLTEGENVLNAVVNNYGRLYEGDFVVKVMADESEVYSGIVRMDAGGIKRLAIPWSAAPGTHTLKADVDAENAVQELNENDNGFTSEVYVMRKPDLSVKILTPVAAEAEGTYSSMGCRNLIPVIMPLLFFISMPRQRRKRYAGIFILVILCATLFLSGCVDEQSGEEQPGWRISSYMVPVELKNDGEAPAMDFTLSIYVDGEKSVTNAIDKLEGGEAITEELSLVVAAGKHSIRAVVDEKNEVDELRRDNNEDEITFVF